MADYKFTIQSKQETVLKSTHVDQCVIDWEDLLFSLRHLEIRILELVYLPESQPLALNTIVEKTRKLNFSERTIRRRIKRLKDLGLIRVVESTIAIINPVINLEKNIRNLTVLWNHRDRNL
jgi:hypothetical protein